MTYLSESLRNEVKSRANGRCEYCLLHERYTMKPHEVDHIFAQKHGGSDDNTNLGLSCTDCNRNKGSDLCSLDEETGEVLTLFHPRRQQWADHFRLNGGVVESLTPTGRITLRLLRINERQRIAERETLYRMRRYPDVEDYSRD